MTVFLSYIVGCVMLSTFIYKVTLYHKYKDEETKETKFERTVYENCFFGEIKAESTSGITKSDVSKFVCRIPGNIEINPDDVIVKGEVSDIVEDVSGRRINDLIQKYKGRAFTVHEVSDNTVLPFLPHTRASGG